MSSSLTYVDKIFESEIKDFSATFLKDYCDPKGKKISNITNKANNIFIAALGKKISVYSTLMRSLDSSLGNRLEKIAKLIAENNFIVKNKIEGFIPKKSVDAIAGLLDKYENHIKRPELKDIKTIYYSSGDVEKIKSHKSDYYLTLKTDPKKKFLIELKIGGDLDNKKAQAEKEALLKQYVLLRNSAEIKPTDTVRIFFCTAYNKYGEEAKWTQERVRQFFSDSEIKVGGDFWNFFCASPNGYKAVKNAYLKYAHFLREVLEKIVEHYTSLNKDYS